MKKIIALLFALQCFAANASLITFDLSNNTPIAGDTLLVDIVINNINADAAELTFDIDFDDVALSFLGFTVADDVLNFGGFGSADEDLFTTGILNVGAYWFFASDKPGTSFTLGQLSFDVAGTLQETFSASNFFAADESYNQINAQSLPQVPVPAPATFVLLALGLVGLRFIKK